jgi:outer membrane receptor protein involved in Fe transport
MNYTSGPANTFNLGFDEDWGKFHWISDVCGADIDGDIRNWAVYANDTITVGDFSFNAGIRYDHNSDFGGEFSPSGGIVYRISGIDALVRAQVAKGFSVPDAYSVYDPILGNPDLGPEKSVHYQLGGEVQPCKFLGLALNIFRAEIRDLITQDPITGKYYNIDKVTRKGAEGSISVNFDFGLALSFGGSYVKVRDEKTGYLIKDIPRKTFNISASYTYQWMTHAIHGKYIDHNSTYSETRDEVFVFDYLLKVKLPFPERHGATSLFAAVYNLTNANYLYRSVWPQPDRWVEGGVRIEF